ncbi:MAG: 3-deoxy-7-phosphoheptulonate synthase [Nitrospinae bacterium]|nr:3-deoxy-7-phosphoheptulonate synthase [Nitrospinota bacterium]
MIVLMKRDATKRQMDRVINKIKEIGFQPHIDHGISTLIGIRGDTSSLDPNIFYMDGVEGVKRVSKPYKEVSKEFHPKKTVIKIGDVEIGGSYPVVIAGPCAVEDERQLLKTAEGVKEGGAHLLRGGAFKPRTSPYSFQGIGEEGLKILADARAKTRLPIVSEIMNQTQIDLFEKYDIDVLQIGARNMQNFDLLKAIGQLKRPVLLKRGPSSSVEEFLLSAEYLLSSGNRNVILCERGIKTFETAYRNVLDFNAVALIKELSHLPIIVDPSHGTGIQSMVVPLTYAAIAVGADGVMVEVHYKPQSAKCDANQQLNLIQFKEMMRSIIR